ncbi:MAG: recombination regulator RecX [Butyrivibrio sp.]|nr:recombination regulator RecX [Butyrivibrio sp.]
MRNYHLQEGQEISETVYNEIKEELLPKRAIKRAMNLLQKKDYTEYKLRQKLSEGLYTPDCIDAALNYVKSYNYVNDERYASDYINYYIELRSKNRIIQDLTSKGISKDILIPLMEEAYANRDDDIELNQAVELLRKKKYDPDNCDFKEKQRLMAFLARKGFTTSVIKSALSLDTTDC